MSANQEHQKSPSVDDDNILKRLDQWCIATFETINCWCNLSIDHNVALERLNYLKIWQVDLYNSLPYLINERICCAYEFKLALNEIAAAIISIKCITGKLDYAVVYGCDDLEALRRNVLSYWRNRLKNNSKHDEFETLNFGLKLL